MTGECMKKLGARLAEAGVAMSHWHGSTGMTGVRFSPPPLTILRDHRMNTSTGQSGSPLEVPFQARRLGRGRYIRPGEFLAESLRRPGRAVCQQSPNFSTLVGFLKGAER